MKKSLCLLFLCAAALSADCSLTFSLAGTLSSKIYDNRAPACSSWTLTYTATGGASVSVQMAPNVQGPWTDFSGFPVSDPPTGTISFAAAPNYIRVVRSATGANLVSGVLTGTKLPASVPTTDQSGRFAIGGPCPAGAPAGSFCAAASYFSGHMLFSTDNTYDIGASGANRPRNIFVANAITVGMNFSRGYVRLNSGDASHSGYVDWFKAGDIRIGYMGYDNDHITLRLEAPGAKFQVIGGDFSASNMPVWTTTVISYSDPIFQVASTTASKTLATLTAGSGQRVCGVTINPTTGFAGTGMTQITASVGSGGTSTFYSPVWPVISPLSADPVWSDTGNSRDGTDTTVQAVFTANTNFGNGSVTSLSQGSVSISVCVVTVQ